MSELTVWLIRHGESSANTGIWGNSQIEIGLTEKGKQQALHAAEQVTQQPDLIILSPFRRAQESAEYLLKCWPKAPVQIWEIQEFTYLSAAKCQFATKEERIAMRDKYWKNADPFFCDGEGAESFANFIIRLQHFHAKLLREHGFLVVVGHGQFFKAYQLSFQKSLLRPLFVCIGTARKKPRNLWVIVKFISVVPAQAHRRQLKEYFCSGPQLSG